MNSSSKALKKCPGSKITFFKNGKSLGAAFEEVRDPAGQTPLQVYQGDYYPGVGLFKGAHVKFNHGERFRYPPQGAAGYKPVAERSRELEVEQVGSWPPATCHRPPATCHLPNIRIASFLSHANIFCHSTHISYTLKQKPHIVTFYLAVIHSD